MHPKVSILIPCYNAEAYLLETLQCCFDQTYPNIEVIVVDDGSTDRSYEIAKTFESPYIHIFKQSNGGGCRARNYAFKKSTGDYIMYLDADDLMSSDKVEKQIALLAKCEYNPYVVATCPYEEFEDSIYRIYFKHRVLYHDYESGVDLLQDAWLNNECMVVSCYMTSRQLIEEVGEWKESLTKNQDGEFFCRVMAKTQKVVYCKDAKFYYRRGHASVSTANKWSESKLQSSLESRIDYEKTVLPLRDTPQIRKGLSQCYAIVMLNSPFKSVWYNGAKQHILALGEKPMHPNPTKMIVFFERLAGFENLLRIKDLLIRLHIKK